MQTDWMGIGLTLIIVLFIILLVWSKMQGDSIMDILRDIRDFVKEGKNE